MIDTLTGCFHHTQALNQKVAKLAEQLEGTHRSAEPGSDGDSSTAADALLARLAALEEKVANQQQPSIAASISRMVGAQQACTLIPEP